MRYNLFYNYHLLNQTWEMIPDDLWRKLLSEYILPGDAVGFNPNSLFGETKVVGPDNSVSCAAAAEHPAAQETAIQR